MSINTTKLRILLIYHFYLPNLLVAFSFSTTVLSERIIKCLAEVEKCSLKPLVNHLFQYWVVLIVYSYRFAQMMCFRKVVSFYRFTTLLKIYLKFMSDTVEICLEKYEFLQRVYIEEGWYKTANHHADMPHQISILYGKCFVKPYFVLLLWFLMPMNGNVKNWREGIS